VNQAGTTRAAGRGSFSVGGSLLTERLASVARRYTAWAAGSRFLSFRPVDRRRDGI